MSWQTYVDSNLVGTGKLAKAAILGQDGFTWASTPGFSLSIDEGLQLMAGFDDAGPLRADGLYAQGERYADLKADERSIYGRRGPCGIVCVKTVRAVMIGVYNESMQPGIAADTVEKLADYLIQCGY
uniref:Profilin n=1 Tax=Arcella intermedia TaxID=1963864 RepID=A0A6B2LS63_9EUKA